ncbi:MAG: DUF3108 domain-containing protein [Nitrospirota bacterium]|nr:DUF3108 domain-containing protein [Nitrospirota bacterium]
MTTGPPSFVRRAKRLSRFWHVSLLIGLFLCPAQAAYPEPNASENHALARPFVPGERLTYAITFLGMRAGTAVMDVQDIAPFEGHPALKLVTTAKSSSTVTKFYPVDNRVESTVDADSLLPFHLLFTRREGKKKNDFDVTFHRTAGTVLSIKDGVSETLPIPPDTHDLISCLYYIRSLPSIQLGSSVMLNLHHDKKNYRVEVRTEGIEKVQGLRGEVEAIRLLVIMPFQGLFLNEGNIRVWLTNDAHRVPLMMKAKIIIGSVVARLIR